jgi:hypothetical protein
VHQLPLRRTDGQGGAILYGRHQDLAYVGWADKQAVKGLADDLFARSYQQQFGRGVDVLDNQSVIQLNHGRKLMVDQLSEKSALGHLAFLWLGL